MPMIAEAVVAPVNPHATVYVTGGGGAIQHVPWNLPANDDVRVGGGFGDSAMFGAFGLTDQDKQKLAQRIRDAMFVSDIAAILEIIPTTAERQEVAALALTLGANASYVQQAMDSLETKQWLKWKPPSTPVRIIWGVLSTASFAASVYHGVKRHHGSIWWGLGWGLMGAMFPVITPAIAFAQGFAQPKKNGLGRSYRRRHRS